MSYAFNSVVTVSDDWQRWNQLSPFDWYLGGEPLVNGVEWASVARFVAMSTGFVLSSVVLFDRRDLEHS